MSGPACIAGTHVQNQIWFEGVHPAAAVVVSDRVALSERGFSHRILGIHLLLVIAEENIVLIAEAVINSHLKSVRGVDRGPVLNKIEGCASGQIWSRQIGFQEGRNAGINQAGRNLITVSPQSLGAIRGSG